jgi:hypothetical protein
MPGDLLGAALLLFATLRGVSTGEFVRMRNWLVVFIKNTYGIDLDHLPFSSGKDGYGPFSALAGFAVAQSAALTAVAKGEKYRLTVLSVYAASVLVTAIWIRSMLRAVRHELPEPSNGAPAAGPGETFRAYDRPSITYGRWTLTWICFVGALMIYLGIRGLLPNQIDRDEYLKLPIECKVEPMSNRGGSWPFIGGTAAERATMDIWQKWLSKTTLDEPEKQRIIWIEQTDKFQGNYRTITCDLSYNSNFKIRGRDAFLVRSDSGSVRPVYRQCAFRLNMQDFSDTDTLYLNDPNDGETVVIIAVIEAVTPEGQRSLDSGPYDIRLVASK